jgi:hypothetical protein
MSEELVYAMSTRGVILIDEFNSLFRMIYSPGISDKQESIDIDIRRQVIRLLDSLGFCEFDFETRRVYMCEPSLVLLPAFGLPKAILAGARTPLLVKKLKDSVKQRKDKMALHCMPQSTVNFSMPSLICIEALDVGLIREVASECGVSADLDKPAAWALANLSVSLEALKQSINFVPFAGLNWKRRTFDVDKLTFSSKGPAGQHSTLLIEYQNPLDRQNRHILRESDRAAEVNRDWGRYMVLSQEDKQVVLYNGKMQKLIVPVTVPLPCLLARAVTLCTGVPPKITTVSAKIGDIPPNHPVYVYSGVPQIIAKLITDKLGQQIIYSSFDFDEDGVLYD